MTTRRPLLAPIIVGLVALAFSGCSIIQNLTGGKAAAKQASQQASELQQLQLQVMGFADEYAGGIREPIQRFQLATQDPEARLLAQNWKLSQSTAAYTIASSPNPVANAVDMVVLATLSRMAIEDAWIGERFGEQAVPLRDAHRHLEQRAWAVVAEILNPDQVAQLRNLIDDWRAQNPNVRAVAYVHLSDFAKSIGRPKVGEEATRKGGLFQLIGLDPIGQLDPAVREITQTRQLAERTIYYAQRAPNLLDMQVERLSYQLAAMPETRRVLADTDNFGSAAASAGRLADKLPEVVAREREAAIRQFMDALNDQSAQMRGLVGELRLALDSGKGTSDSVNATIRSLDQLMARFDKPKPADAPPEPPGRPFDITEYTAAAAEFSRTANQLQQLVASLAQGAPALAESAGQAAAQLRSVLDHLIWRAFAMGLALVFAVFAAALGYRFVTRRWLA
jgi:hypothetical protein